METDLQCPPASSPRAARGKSRWGRAPRRVLLVGGGAVLERVRRSLARPGSHRQIVGLFCDEGADLSAELQAVRLGSLHDLFGYLPAHDDVDELFAALPAEAAEQVDFLSKYADTHGIRFFYVPPYQIFGGYQHSLTLDGTALLTHRREPLSRLRNAALKRGFDLLCSSVALVVLFPLSFLYTLVRAKRKDAAAPVLIGEEMGGFDGRVFRAWRFNAAAGTALRHLPRLWNVWKGDMSLVGHAPYPLRLTQDYTQTLAHFMVHHFGRPGLRSISRLRGLGGDALTAAQRERVVEAEIAYAEGWNFGLDLRILFSRNPKPRT